MSDPAVPPPPPEPPRPKSVGTVRIVIGIVILVLFMISLPGALAAQAASGDRGGVAETLGALFGRLLVIALGVLLIVSGARAKGRLRRGE